MKYRIGQRLFERDFHYGEDGPDYTIVCLGLFGDGVWKYGVKYDDSEYDSIIDFYTEDEMDEEFTEYGGEE